MIDDVRAALALAEEARTQLREGRFGAPHSVSGQWIEALAGAIETAWQSQPARPTVTIDAADASELLDSYEYISESWTGLSEKTRAKRQAVIARVRAAREGK